MTGPRSTADDTKAEYDAQRRACQKRDGNTCRFERYKTLTGPKLGVLAGWGECGSKGRVFTCHIIRRDKCGKAYAHEDVALMGCLECHDAFDGRSLHDPKAPKVRIPIARFRLAKKTVRANSKDHSYLNAATIYGVYQDIPAGIR